MNLGVDSSLDFVPNCKIDRVDDVPTQVGEMLVLLLINLLPLDQSCGDQEPCTLPHFDKLAKL